MENAQLAAEVVRLEGCLAVLVASLSVTPPAAPPCGSDEVSFAAQAALLRLRLQAMDEDIARVTKALIRCAKTASSRNSPKQQQPMPTAEAATTTSQVEPTRDDRNCANEDLGTTMNAIAVKVFTSQMYATNHSSSSSAATPAGSDGQCGWISEDGGAVLSMDAAAKSLFVAAPQQPSGAASQTVVGADSPLWQVHELRGELLEFKAYEDLCVGIRAALAEAEDFQRRETAVGDVHLRVVRGQLRAEMAAIERGNMLINTVNRRLGNAATKNAVNDNRDGLRS